MALEACNGKRYSNINSHFNIKRINESTRADVAGLVSIETEHRQCLAAVDEQAVSKPA